MPTSKKALAAKLIENGFRLARLRHATKIPKDREWQQRVLSPDDFTEDCGIGIVLGHDDLVAVDVDSDDRC
jgi:hypothetical protein